MTANIDLRSHKHKPVTAILSHIKCDSSVSASLMQLFFSYSICLTYYILFKLFYLLIIRLCIFKIWYWDFFPRKYTEDSVVVTNYCTEQPTLHRIDDGT